MSGFIYFILNPAARAVKIGYAADVRKRLSTIGVSSPDKIKLVASIPGTRDDERRIHTALRGNCKSGEWFEWGLITHELMERAKAGATIDELVDFATPEKLFQRLQQRTGRLVKEIEEQLA
jgi:hypothetical protein